MGIIVTKFGGSSLADAGQFRKVRDILLANPERRFVVPSAPGKRSKSDVKVTDIAKTCTAADFEKGHVIIKKGKKVFHKVVLK